METRIPLLSLDEERHLFGPYDRHVREAERRFGIRMGAREGTLRLHGPDDPVGWLSERVERLLVRIREGLDPSPAQVERTLFGEDQESPRQATTPAPARPVAEDGSPAVRIERQAEAQSRARDGHLPTARTAAQQAYLDAMQSEDLVVAEGPAGTGKTYLAVAAAVAELQSGRVRRLILTRPAVEAGERLGFLPGDYEAKVDPYLRPLYDALRDLLGPRGFRRLKELDIVEIAPLAFMRGRTLNQAFVILDEAQNATVGQLKMFLTRLGEGSRAVVTGDSTQTDLPEGQSGLDDATKRLRSLKGVAMIQFTREDIQRSPLVQRIVEAYGDETR